MNISILRATLLSTILFLPLTLVAQVTQSNQFLIEFSGGNKEILASSVSNAGGSLKAYLSDLGYAIATSENPKFAKKLKSDKNVQNCVPGYDGSVDITG